MLRWNLWLLIWWASAVKSFNCPSISSLDFLLFVFGGVIECNYFVYLPIWGLMSRSRGDSADDPADEDPRHSLASPGLWWFPSLPPLLSDEDDFCCVNRSCFRNLARRFWNQTYFLIHLALEKKKKKTVSDGLLNRAWCTSRPLVPHCVGYISHVCVSTKTTAK